MNPQRGSEPQLRQGAHHATNGGTYTYEPSGVEIPPTRAHLMAQWKGPWHLLPVGLVLIAALVIAVGGIIRIYDAGESCPDWPTCFGTWGFDVSPEEQAIWWENNPEEIDSRGADHRYTTFEIFTEWIHRAIAGALLGPLVILQYLIVRAQRESLANRTHTLALLSLILVIWQGFLGYITVKWDNEHWSVALHLASALIFTLALIGLWISWRKDNGYHWNLGSGPRTLAHLRFSALSTLTVLFVGAFVSTTENANVACGVSGFPDSWPLCSGGLGILVQDIIAQSQFIHRWLVLIVGVILLRIWITRSEWTPEIRTQQLMSLGTGLYGFNVLLGGAYVLSWTADSGFIEWISVLHLLLASVIFLVFSSAILMIRIDAEDSEEE